MTLLRDMMVAYESRETALAAEGISSVKAVAKSIVLHHIANEKVVDKFDCFLRLNDSESIKECFVDELEINISLATLFDGFIQSYLKRNDKCELLNKWTQNEFDTILEAYMNKRLEYTQLEILQSNALSKLSDTTKLQYDEQFRQIAKSISSLYISLLKDAKLNE